MKNTMVCYLGVLLLLSCYPAAKSLPLPSYITPCSRNEVNVTACFTKRAREAIPYIVKGPSIPWWRLGKPQFDEPPPGNLRTLGGDQVDLNAALHGDRKYKIPVLDPLMITKIHVDEGVLGLNFTANGLVVTGLRNTFVDSVELDLKNHKSVYKLSIPRMELISKNYNISGRILILPITGSGRSNITIVDVKATYVYDFDFVKKADGLTYILPTRSDLSFETSRMYIYLDNLFNGNKLLGDEMNKFMDENWSEMVRELGPVISNSIGEVMRRIQFNVFDLVDYDSSFPDIPV